MHVRACLAIPNDNVKHIKFYKILDMCLMMESGGSFLYASCGGGFLQPMTV